MQHCQIRRRRIVRAALQIDLVALLAPEAGEQMRHVVRAGLALQRVLDIGADLRQLDDALLEFSCRLPVEYKLRGLKLRWFFKEALRGFLPDEIITKKKHGFGLPFGVGFDESFYWFNTETIAEGGHLGGGQRALLERDDADVHRRGLRLDEPPAGLSPILTGAANTSGGVMGKMISPQSLAVATAATAKVKPC